MALAFWPEQPDPWLQDWILWRIGDGKSATRPTTAPPTIPPYGNEFRDWAVWKRKGMPLPRPDVIKTIPKWAYPIYEKLNKTVPVALPPEPHPWLLSWAIWRFKNSPPDQKPAGLPSSVTVSAPYCWSFLRWCEWQRNGKKVPRPLNIPSAIPPWAFSLLRQTNQAVPPKPLPPPPPPPDPPPPPVGDSSWKLPFPLMFLSWGPVSDSQYRDNDEAFQMMRTAGVKTVAPQIGNYLPNFPARCRAFGFKVALWGRASSLDAEALAVAGADGYIPQIEGLYEYLDAINYLEAGVGRGLSIATVTTLAGIRTYTHNSQGQVNGSVEAARLEAAGCNHALVECYIQDGGAHFPIGTMMWDANRIFDHANPVIGLYHETPLGVYRPAVDPTSLDSFGRQIGVYLAEGMTPSNWAEVGALGT